MNLTEKRSDPYKKRGKDLHVSEEWGLH